MKKLEIKENYDDVNWEEVIPVLMAFALSLLGEKRFSNSKKKLAQDFTMDTILKYLDNKDKFDPSRNSDLINYLKYNILRQVISNFKKSSWVSTRSYLKIENNDDENKESDYLLDNLFYQNASYIEDSVDLDFLLLRIEIKLKRDIDLNSVFDLFYKKNYTRSEICEELNISLREFDNRLRRLKRILDKEVKSFLKVSDER